MKFPSFEYLTKIDQTNLLKSKKARDMLLFQFQKSNAAIRAMRELKKEF